MGALFFICSFRDAGDGIFGFDFKEFQGLFLFSMFIPEPLFKEHPFIRKNSSRDDFFFQRGIGYVMVVNALATSFLSSEISFLFLPPAFRSKSNMGPPSGIIRLRGSLREKRGRSLYDTCHLFEVTFCATEREIGGGFTIRILKVETVKDFIQKAAPEEISRRARVPS